MSVFPHPLGGEATTWFAVSTYLLFPITRPVPLRLTLDPSAAFPRIVTMTTALAMSGRLLLWAGKTASNDIVKTDAALTNCAYGFFKQQPP
jgi:hypothetical protein